MSNDQKLVVVGGANGTGKTTFALEYASKHQLQYIAADEIAARMAPDDPSRVQIAAGRKFVHAINHCIDAGESAVVESTLAGRSFARTLHQARNRGFRIVLYYVYVKEPQLCVTRVKQRVRKGGHDVPKVDIVRRFHRSITNFWTIYRQLADKWVLMYNGDEAVVDVASGDGREFDTLDADRHREFLRLL